MSNNASRRISRVGYPERLVVSASAFVEVVEESREGAQVLLEDEDTFMFEDVSHLAVGVQNVAELPRSGRADLHAGRHPALARPLQTECALLHDALGTRSVGQISHVGV